MINDNAKSLRHRINKEIADALDAAAREIEQYVITRSRDVCGSVDQMHCLRFIANKWRNKK